MAGGCCLPDEKLTSERARARIKDSLNELPINRLFRRRFHCNDGDDDDEGGGVKEKEEAGVASYSWSDAPESVITTYTGM